MQIQILFTPLPILINLLGNCIVDNWRILYTFHINDKAILKGNIWI